MPLLRTGLQRLLAAAGCKPTGRRVSRVFISTRPSTVKAAIDLRDNSGNVQRKGTYCACCVCAALLTTFSWLQAAPVTLAALAYQV